MPRGNAITLSRRALLRVGVAGGASTLAAAAPPFGALLPRGILAAPSSADAAALSELVVLEDTAVYLYGKLAAAIAPPSPAAGAPPATDPLTQMAGFADLHTVHRDTLVRALRGAGGVVPPLDLEHPGLLPPSAATADALNSLDRVESGIAGGQYAALGTLVDRGLVGLVASLYGIAARRQGVVSRAAGRGDLHGPLVIGDAAATQTLLSGRVP